MRILLASLFLLYTPAIQADTLEPLLEGDPETVEDYFDDDYTEEEGNFSVGEETFFSEDNLTPRQGAFYWSTFNWMMEWGKDEEIKAFEDKETQLRVISHAGSRFLTGSPRLCRPYALKLERGVAQIQRSGIACQVESEHWCRLRDGKHEQCRMQGPGEWDNVINSMEIKQRDLSISAERFFRDLGF